MHTEQIKKDFLEDSKKVTATLKMPFAEYLKEGESEDLYSFEKSQEMQKGKTNLMVFESRWRYMFFTLAVLLPK